jgi:hypothetical protein
MRFLNYTTPVARYRGQDGEYGDLPLDDFDTDTFEELLATLHHYT